MSGTSWRYRQDIDGLRALAVAIVILFHFEFAWVPGGFVGVDVFFVISGFLITSLIARQIAEGRFSLIDFYERRFRRIYPNLLIVLAVTAVLGFLAMVPLTYRPFGRSLIWATLSASNFAFIGGDGYFDPDNLTKPLLHTWSLGVEEQFYLVFPWLLILAAKRGYSAKWLIGIIVGLSLALSIGAAFADWAPSYFLLPTRFWELGIGALIAILPASDRLSYVQRSTLGTAGLLAIGWSALRLTQSDPFPGYLALAPTLGAATVIWANGGIAARILSLPPFVWTGRLSFSLYLWHWPLISIAAGIFLPPTAPATRVVITVIILILSAAGYLLWEQPIRQKRLLAGRRVFFAVLAAFAALLVAAGIVIFETRGLPQRLTAEERAVIDKAITNSFLIEKRCPELTSEHPASCPLGDEAADKVSFVIVGDSHAAAAAEEIGDIAKNYGLRGVFLGKSACEFLKDTTIDDRTYCFAQFGYAMGKIREYDPKLVIMISRWAFYVEAASQTGEVRRVYRKGALVSEPDRQHAIAEAFDETLSELGPRKVVTALTVPEFKVELQVRDFIVRRLQGLGLPASQLALTQVDYEHRQVYVRKLLSTAEASHDNLTVFDPSPLFCATGICKEKVGNDLLYKDSDHLTHTGALLYAQLFDAPLAALARKVAAQQ